MLRPEQKIVSQQMEPNLWPSLLLHSHSKKGLVLLSQVIFFLKTNIKRVQPWKCLKFLMFW